jgi:hypothetical protein
VTITYPSSRLSVVPSTLTFTTSAPAPTIHTITVTALDDNVVLPTGALLLSHVVTIPGSAVGALRCVYHRTPTRTPPSTNSRTAMHPFVHRNALILHVGWSLSAHVRPSFAGTALAPAVAVMPPDARSSPSPLLPFLMPLPPPPPVVPGPTPFSPHPLPIVRRCTAGFSPPRM